MAAPAEPTYPFAPKSTAKLRAGQFWALPLSDGRFGCVRVLALRAAGEPGARTSFVAGLLDWVGSEPPTADRIAGAPIIEHGHVHVGTVVASGGQILGHRDLASDAIGAPRAVAGYLSDRYLQLRADRLFVQGDPPPAFERREVASPLTDEMLRPFTSPAGVAQFRSLLSGDELARLAELLRRQPHIGLRAYGSYDGSIADLEFLRFFPTLRHFSADALHHSLGSLDGLRHLPADLASLDIGATKSRLDLAVLERFAQLRSLGIEAQTKNLAVVSQLTTLEELLLRSVTLPDLSLLTPLTGLRSLELKLGGTRDLGLLPEVGRLEHVELWRIKGLDDLSAVGRLPHLRYLFLQSLPHVDALPDFAGTPSLRRLHVEALKGLTDMRPIAAAAGLEDLLLVDMPHLSVDDLECLVGLPSLRSVSFGLGSRKRNDAARARVGLPDVEGFKVPWRQV